MLTAARRQNLDGFYDPHTNIMQYPTITQPTHARWEQIPPSSTLPSSMNETAKALTNGDVTHINDHNHELVDRGQQEETNFPPIRPLYSRNFLIVDTHFITPPISGLGIPGPDGHVLDIKQNGLTDVPDGVLSELSPDCLQAFIEARDAELKWRAGWRTEQEDGARARFKVDYNLSG